MTDLGAIVDGKELERRLTESFSLRFPFGLCLLAVVLTTMFWFMAGEALRGESYAEVESAAVRIVLVMMLMSLFGLTGAVMSAKAFGAVRDASTSPRPGEDCAVLAVRPQPIAGPLATVGVAGALVAPALAAMPWGPGVFLAVALPSLAVVLVVPTISSWLRARAGAVAVVRSGGLPFGGPDDGAFQLVHVRSGRVEEVRRRALEALETQVARDGARWLPGALDALRRWHARGALHPTAEEVQRLRLPARWVRHGDAAGEPTAVRRSVWGTLSMLIGPVAFLNIFGWGGAFIAFSGGNWVGAILFGGIGMLGIYGLISTLLGATRH